MQPPLESDNPVPMEYLDVNDGWGQSYGYTLYRTIIPSTSEQVKIFGLRDFGVVSIIITISRKETFVNFTLLCLSVKVFSAFVEGSSNFLSTLDS